MGFNNQDHGTNNEMWECHGEEYMLQRELEDDVSQYLCDEFNQCEASFFCIMDEQTPVKDCAEFGYQPSGSGDWDSENTGKELEECSQSSQVKRRRMLQFSPDKINIGNDHSASNFLKSKAREDSQMEEELPDNFSWNLQWESQISDDSRAPLFEDLVQLPNEWQENVFHGTEAHYGTIEGSGEMSFNEQVDVSGFYDTAPAAETNMCHMTPHPCAKMLKGKKSFLTTPRKFTTSVAYPFALVKPCGGQGGVTLKEINQRIHAPPPSKSKHVKDDSDCYPTSAFSGKPVVVKTKIHTEGGKGSITIMRTKAGNQIFSLLIAAVAC